jgi:hypothetical protein
VTSVNLCQENDHTEARSRGVELILRASA